jgi:hypothetical protein
VTRYADSPGLADTLKACCGVVTVHQDTLPPALPAGARGVDGGSKRRPVQEVTPCGQRILTALAAPRRGRTGGGFAESHIQIWGQSSPLEAAPKWLTGAEVVKIGGALAGYNGAGRSACYTG